MKTRVISALALAIAIAGLVAGAACAQQLQQAPALKKFTPLAPKAVNPQPLPPGQAQSVNPLPLPPKSLPQPATQGVAAPRLVLSKRVLLKAPLAADSLQAQQKNALNDSSKFAAPLRDTLMAKKPGSGQFAALAGLTVNDKTAGLKFTPGGQYIIRGKDFGSDAGTVFLQSDALGSTRTFKVNAWTDTAIYAELPADIRGARDALSVLLVIAPKGKAAIENHGFGFLAARESIELPRLPGGAQVLALAAAKYLHREDGRVVRQASAESLACFAPGYDVIAVDKVKLGNGFEIDGFLFDYDDRAATGNYGGDLERSGGYYRDGAYAARWQGADAVRVDWSVFRHHESPYLPAGFRGRDSCESTYEIHFTASGPRGVKPF